MRGQYGDSSKKVLHGIKLISILLLKNNGKNTGKADSKWIKTELRSTVAFSKHNSRERINWGKLFLWMIMWVRSQSSAGDCPSRGLYGERAISQRRNVKNYDQSYETKQK